jgi:serine protease Do
VKPILFFLGLLLSTAWLHAAEDIPLIRPEERQAVDEQADEFNEALMPVIKEVAKSTVRVWVGNRRLAYGTVVGDGRKIVTKWSEIARAKGTMRVEAGGEQLRAVAVKGVYESEDLAVLEVEGEPLTPVKWSFEKPELGTFLVAPQPDGRPAAFGVVSVLERNLRDTDKAFLGVNGDQEYRGTGVKIGQVSAKSGAADAGLRVGDVIVRVNGRAISGMSELKNSLTGVKPGDQVKLRIETGSKQRDVDVVLGNRPEMQQFSGQRLEQMERMGGAISQVRDSFSLVIQTDMRPKPNQVGGPVVDLKGNVLGVTIARADRTRSFVIPAAKVEELLKSEPIPPTLAQVEKPQEREPVRSNPRQRNVPPPTSEEQMSRHLDDMQRLMDHMRTEMEALEEREAGR